MDKLVRGVRRFRESVFEQHADLFKKLSTGQGPSVLFITCCDSRVDPCLITQTLPGDMMVIRNAGNIIPPSSVESGEAATIELCVVEIGVRHIIVCGHSGCGAMKCLLWPQHIEGTKTVGHWLAYAEPARQRALKSHPSAEGDRLHELTIKENVIEQLENLAGLPFVAERTAQGQLELHGWYYDIGRGAVSTLDSVTGRFEALA